MKRIPAIAGLLLFAALFASAETKASGGLITPEKAKALLAADKAAVLMDVRTEEEFAEGRIKGAVLLPYDLITADSASRLIPSKETTVVVYCRSGRRSAIAAKTLRSLGYKTVWDLGGIQAWPYGTVK